MGNAASTYPMVIDAGFNAAGVDPNVGPALQALETFIGGYSGPAAIKNVTMQNFMDELATSTLQPSSGAVALSLVQLRAGQVINNINVLTAATAVSAATHSWAGIASYVAGSNGVALAVSADGGSAASMAADAVVTFALAPAYTVPASGYYYVYYCIVATTVPTFAAAPTLSGHGRGNIAPFPAGPGDTGKTTPYAVGATVTAPTATAANPLVYLN